MAEQTTNEKLAEHEPELARLFRQTRTAIDNLIASTKFSLADKADALESRREDYGRN